MAKTEKEPIEHKDILGNPILETSKLAISYKNDLYICSVEKITPKMLKAKIIGKGNTWRSELLVKPERCVVVDGPDVLAYILKGQK